MDAGFKGHLQWMRTKLFDGLKATPMKEIMLPLDFPSAEYIANKGYTFENIKIWKEVTSALNFERELPRELTQYLGVKHRLGLFRMDPSKRRQVYRCAPRKEDLGYQPVVDFHDAVCCFVKNL